MRESPVRGRLLAAVSTFVAGLLLAGGAWLSAVAIGHDNKAVKQSQRALEERRLLLDRLVNLTLQLRETRHALKGKLVTLAHVAHQLQLRVSQLLLFIELRGLVPPLSPPDRSGGGGNRGPPGHPPRHHPSPSPSPHPSPSPSSHPTCIDVPPVPPVCLGRV